jgi:hypothetical protein
MKQMKKLLKKKELWRNLEIKIYLSVKSIFRHGKKKMQDES